MNNPTIDGKSLSEIEYLIRNTFKDLEFEEKSHTYSVNYTEYDFSKNETVNVKKELVSCTTINKKFASFNADKIATNKAKKDKVSKESLLNEWALKSQVAAENGTKIHHLLEKKIIDPNFILEDALLDNFYRWLMANYIPIIAECRMYCLEYGIAGTSDLIAYNKKTGKLAIIDYKTGKPIVKVPTYRCKYTNKMKTSKFMLEPPFNKLHNSNFNKYSIQLSEYKLILKKMCNLEIDELMLIHFSDNRFTPIYASKIGVTKLFKGKNKIIK